MSLSDVVWVFVTVIFTAIVGCVVWILREERKR